MRRHPRRLRCIRVCGIVAPKTTRGAVMPQASREEIDRLIQEGDASRARAALAQLWMESPTPGVAGFVVSRFEPLRPHLSFTCCRVAILRSFTVEPAVPLLRAMGFCGGIDLDVRLGGFNAYAQDILDAAGWLYGFSPDVVILAVQTRDIVPQLWEAFADLSATDVQAITDQAIGTFRQLVQALRSHSEAHLIVHGLETPAVRCLTAMENSLVWRS